MGDTQVTIPEHDADCVLRNVTLGETGYRVLLWDTYRRETSAFSRCYLGYAFFAPDDDEPIFAAEDFSPPPSYAIDSDDSLRSLVGWLTLGKGDTDSEYFEGYSERQLSFRDGNDRENLSMWGMDPDYGSWEVVKCEACDGRGCVGCEEGERKVYSHEWYRFIDVDTCHGCGCDMSHEDHYDSCDRAEWNRTREGGSVL